MRRTLLVTAAIGSLLAGAGAAQAAGLVPPDLMFGQPYVEFGGGFNFTSVTLTDLQTNAGCCDASVTSSTPLNIGSTIYGSIGTTVMPGLRVELQGSLRNNSGAHFNVSAEGGGAVGVDTKTFMLLGNVWKDFDVGNGLSFHVGGGLGFGSKTLTVTGATPTTQTVSGLAYLLGIGADYALQKNMTLTFNYTVSNVTGTFGTSTIATGVDTSHSGPVDETVTGILGKGMDESATVGLRFALAP